MAGRGCAQDQEPRSRPRTTTPPPAAGLKPIENAESRLQVETLLENVEGVRAGMLGLEGHPAGHRARHRAGAGLHPAGHHHGLRRQPYLDARRLRRAGLRHRHLGGRACAGNPDTVCRSPPKPCASVSMGSCRWASRRRTSRWRSSASIGTAGGTGYVIEFAGEAIRALSMEGRMTICNMSIEAGARAGMVAPDETTFAYVQGRPHGA